MGVEPKEIILERGSHGLGFNIRGGVDIQYLPGENGIFVTKIREDGAAYKDGRLQEGDKIVEVNGISLEKVTHSEAVQAFVNAGETVELKVINGEEARVNKKTGGRGSNSSSSQDGGSVGVIVAALVIVTGIAVGGYFAFKKFVR